MTEATYTRTTSKAQVAAWRLSARQAQAILATVIIAAGVMGSMATDAGSARAVAAAGSDLTRVLRAMAVIKALMAAAAVAAVVWRLSMPVRALRLALYVAACAAMAAGPALIWNLTGLGVGTLLLHAGLAVAVIMLWRDPAVRGRVAQLVAERRAALAR